MTLSYERLEEEKDHNYSISVTGGVLSLEVKDATNEQYALTCTRDTCSCNQIAAQWNQAMIYTYVHQWYGTLFRQLTIPYNMSVPCNAAKLGITHSNI